MKQKLFSVFIVLFVSLSICQESDPLASYEGGSCSNGCVSCSKYGSLEMCYACKNSKHEMTTAINGKCTGTESPIPNCDISYGWKEHQWCAKCKDGYGTEWDYDSGNGDKRKMAYFKSCKKIETKGVLGAAWLNKEDGTTAYHHHTCEFGYSNVYDSKLGLRRCRIETSNIVIKDENCQSYSFSGKCSQCLPPYTLDKDNAKCIKPPYNSGLIRSNSLEYPFLKKYSYYCQTDVEDIRLENLVGTGLSNFNSYIYGIMIETSSTNNMFKYIPSFLNTVGWCRSEKYGSVGDDTSTSANFGYLISGFLLIFFYISNLN